jgi:hypothetical protein
MDLFLRKTVKAMGGHGTKWENKYPPHFDSADDLSVLDENVSETNNFWKFCELTAHK